MYCITDGQWMDQWQYPMRELPLHSDEGRADTSDGEVLNASQVLTQESIFSEFSQSLEEAAAKDEMARAEEQRKEEAATDEARRYHVLDIAELHQMWENGAFASSARGMGLSTQPTPMAGGRRKVSNSGEADDWYGLD